MSGTKRSDGSQKARHSLKRSSPPKKKKKKAKLRSGENVVSQVGHQERNFL